MAEPTYFVCVQAQQGLCFATEESAAQARCESVAGAVWTEDGACPTGVVAECANERELRYFYDGYPFDVAEASCTTPLTPPSH